MPQRDFEGQILRDAARRTEGRHLPGTGELDPGVRMDSRLIPVAQWIAFIGGFPAAAAGVLAAMTFVSAKDWGDRQAFATGAQWYARGGGALAALLSVIAGAFFAVFVYATARSLYARPRRGAIAFTVVAGILAVTGAVFLAAPGLIMGDEWVAAQIRSSVPVSDADLVGFALVASAALIAIAAGLTAGAYVRMGRRRSDALPLPAGAEAAADGAIAAPAGLDLVGDELTHRPACGEAIQGESAPGVPSAWSAAMSDAPSVPSAPQAPEAPEWNDEAPDA